MVGLGTYCWNSGADSAGIVRGLCVNKLGVPTPRDPLQVNAVPFTAHFSFPLEDPPTGASLTLIPVRAEGELTVQGTPACRWWQFGEGETVELPLGVETEVELSPQPGLVAHWQIFLIHAGTVYQVSVFPKGDDFAQAAPDVNAVWNAVSASLTFFE